MVEDFLETSSIGLHRVGPDGTILWANEADHLFLGYGRDEYVGRNIVEFHADRPVIDDILARLTRGERIKDYRARLRAKDGSIRHVLIDSSVRFDDGKFQHTRCFTRDVTTFVLSEEARSRAEASLLAANERLSELDAMKTRLINNASHELRTPLTPIGLHLSMLRMPETGPLTERQARSLDVIDRNMRQLTLLVQDILDVARLQAGRLTLDKERIDLVPLLAAGVDSFQDAAKNAGVAMTLQTEGPLRVDADPKRVTQVLYNLLSNALKFTGPGGHIAVEAARAGEEVVVTVRDSGAGIPVGQISRLFQPFTQIHEDESRAHRGTGLGLFISKGIVEQHEGRIWAASDGRGLGATFGFALRAASLPASHAVPVAARPEP